MSYWIDLNSIKGSRKFPRSIKKGAVALGRKVFWTCKMVTDKTTNEDHSRGEEKKNGND